MITMFAIAAFGRSYSYSIANERSDSSVCVASTSMHSNTSVSMDVAILHMQIIMHYSCIH